MTEVQPSARHRATASSFHSLFDLGRAAKDVVVGPMGRRAAAVAATSGVVLSLTAISAQAAPAPQEHSTKSVEQTVAPKPVVGVAEDASWDLAATVVVAAVAPPAGPTPEELAEQARLEAEAARQERAERNAQREASRRQAATQRQATPAAPAEGADAEATPVNQEAAPAPAQAASGSSVVDYARNFIGTPYRSGGASPAAFDCSGFTQYVFAHFGINLPRTSSAQRYAGQVVSAAEARAGDLVWWPGHIGIYTGNGQHIAARNPGSPLHESRLYRGNPTFIRVG